MDSKKVQIKKHAKEIMIIIMQIITLIKNMLQDIAMKDIKVFYAKNVQIIMKKELKIIVFLVVIF